MSHGLRILTVRDVHFNRFWTVDVAPAACSCALNSLKETSRSDSGYLADKNGVFVGSGLSRLELITRLDVNPNGWGAISTRTDYRVRSAHVGRVFARPNSWGVVRFRALSR